MILMIVMVFTYMNEIKSMIKSKGIENLIDKDVSKMIMSFE